LPSTVTGSTCLHKYTCTAGSAQPACISANAFIGLKEQMVAPSKVFKCRRFMTGSTMTDVVCNPKDMTKVNGVWKNDCIYSSGGSEIMYTRDVDCSLQEFEDYISEFDSTLASVFDRLDSEATAFATSIGTDLKTIVDKHLVDPAMVLIDGIRCGFMGKFYDGVIDGLCFQGVVGIRMVSTSYVVLGLSLMLLAIVMYMNWRVAIDTVNAAAQSKG